MLSIVKSLDPTAVRIMRQNILEFHFSQTNSTYLIWKLTSLARSQNIHTCCTFSWFWLLIESRSRRSNRLNRSAFSSSHLSLSSEGTSICEPYGHGFLRIPPPGGPYPASANIVLDPCPWPWWLGGGRPGVPMGFMCCMPCTPSPLMLGGANSIELSKLKLFIEKSAKK